MTKMPNMLPPALVELIADPNGERAKEQFSALAKGMQEIEGIPLRSICRGLAGLLMDLCMEEYLKWDEHRHWAKRFLIELRDGIHTTSRNIEITEEQMLEAKRNREAGGTGTHLQ